jgi:hypothetical protein
MVFTATPTSQHIYGMATAEDAASTTLMTNVISNFSVVCALTQDTLCNTNRSINVLEGQTHMLCNIIGNQPSPGMIQYPQHQQGHGCRSCGSRGCCGHQQVLGFGGGGGYNGGGSNNYNGSDGANNGGSGGGSYPPHPWRNA